MPSEPKYPLTMSIELASHLLGLSPVDVLQEAGFDEPEIAGAGDGVTAKQYFDIWRATERLAARKDLSVFVGKAIARGPVIPAFLALDCAPDLERGLRRLTRFKSLVGPTRMHVYDDEKSLTVEYESASSDTSAPPGLSAVYLAYIVEKARLLTSSPITPIVATLDGPEPLRETVSKHIGTRVTEGAVASVAWRRSDAQLPFLSVNQSLWPSLEHDLQLQLKAQNTDIDMQTRVAAELYHLLPTGRSDLLTVCDQLEIGRSTVQRQLALEGTSYQAILDQTRCELAHRYLTKSSLKNSEIAAALAYTDTNSFYRSFRRWTNQTPKDVRQKTHLA